MSLPRPEGYGLNLPSVPFGKDSFDALGIETQDSGQHSIAKNRVTALVTNVNQVAFKAKLSRLVNEHNRSVTHTPTTPPNPEAVRSLLARLDNVNLNLPYFPMLKITEAKE